MTDIFQEVEEEIRRERVEQLWKKHGPLIVGIAAGVVILTAGIMGWRAYDERARTAQSRDYQAAAEQLATDPGAAVEAFAALGAKSGRYALVARFRQAEALTQLGRKTEAVAIYDKIAADSGAPDKLRDLAVLKSVYLTADGMSVTDLQARLAPLMRADSPFRHSARELLAYAMLKAGDRDAAMDAFRKIADDSTAPESLRGRVAEFLTAFGPAPGKTISEAPAPRQP